MEYRPKPRDTSAVTLPEGLKQLTEQLAEQAHETWAERRMREGWQYGSARDDELKRHPDLVPYGELPESEKEYDRAVALHSVKTVLALGYRIDPPERRDAEEATIELALRRLRGGERLVVSDLIGLWRSVTDAASPSSPEVFVLLANRLLALDEPLVAYDVVHHGLERFRDHVRLRQLRAVALKRSGAAAAANAIASALVAEDHADGETLGILASTHRVLARQARTRRERDQELETAQLAYERGYRVAVANGALDDAIYAGINAASVAFLLGRERAAQATAGEVQRHCEARLADGADYWAEASFAEAALVLGDLETARSWYARAAATGRGHYANLTATRQQARELLRHRGDDEHGLDVCFGIPVVIAFSGHMVDAPNRWRPRFPAALEPRVASAIEAALEPHPEIIAYGGAAGGADILFLEAALARGGQVNVVIPGPIERYREESVPAAGSWRARFDCILERAAHVELVDRRGPAGDASSFEYANLITAGLAKLRAEQLHTDLLPLAVWDGRPGDGPGGTASVVAQWRAHGPEPEVIDLRSMLAGLGAAARSGGGRTPARRRGSTPSRRRQRILAMLFADVVGFSTLDDEHIPRFVAKLMGAVARLGRRRPGAVLSRNTWGDGLYYVFRSVAEAGRFALDLRDMVVATDWTRHGFPHALNLRIGLHAGPVYVLPDPVLGRRTYSGTHVNWAARIEPITVPGQVYASLPFAALAAVEDVRAFACEYAGMIPLAKKFDTVPVYRVSRHRAR